MTTRAAVEPGQTVTPRASHEFGPAKARHPDSISSADRRAWAERYGRVRAFTETLCAPLKTEDYVIQSMPDASPAKWHLAHTSWFFQTFVLKPGLAGYGGGDPNYAYLFNSYYNAVGPMHCRAQRGMISRPTVDEVHTYREQTDEAMRSLIADATDEEWRAVEPIIDLGLHHEQQHQELLLTDLKHMFAQNPLRPAYRPTRASERRDGSAPWSPAWSAYDEGVYWIGHDDEGFCFDNEKPRHRAFVGAFQLAQRLVTNGEYLAFIEDRGYERPELWLSLGWMTVREQKWTAPLYWENRNNAWHEFTLTGLRPLDPAEPVTHVSYFEADAFARWSATSTCSNAPTASSMRASVSKRLPITPCTTPPSAGSKCTSSAGARRR